MQKCTTGVAQEGCSFGNWCGLPQNKKALTKIVMENSHSRLYCSLKTVGKNGITERCSVIGIIGAANPFSIIAGAGNQLTIRCIGH